MNELDRLTTALLALALALGPTGGAASAPSPAQARYDVIIRHGRVLDGHGTLPNLTTQGFTTAVIDAEGRDVIWPLSQERSAFH